MAIALEYVAAAEDRPASVPIVVAVYLKAARGLVAEASLSRQGWIRELGALLRDVDEAAADRARAAGAEQRSRFLDLRARLEILPVPAACDECQSALIRWLDKHVAACEVMADAGASGDLTRLRVAQGMLAEARVDLQRYNAAFALLVDVLRRRADARQAKRKSLRLSWPFVRRAKSVLGTAPA